MSAKLSVISAAFYESTDAIQPFLRSCSAHGIDPHLYGIGEQWTSFCYAKVSRLINAIKSIKTDFVLYVDSGDVLFQSNLDVLFDAYRTISSGIVISGDIKCWPHTGLRVRFRKLFPLNPLVKFPCAGIFIGPKDEVVKALEAIERTWLGEQRPLKQKLENDDQWYWQEMICEGTIKATIDYYCKISLSIHGMNEYQIEDGIVKTADGGVPCIAHFNGDSSKWLYLDVANQLYGNTEVEC